MLPFITSLWMISTWGSYHLHDGTKGEAAIFTGVPRFLTAFVKLMTTTIRAIRVISTWGADKLPGISKTLSTVLTIECFHNLASLG